MACRGTTRPYRHCAASPETDAREEFCVFSSSLVVGALAPVAVLAASPPAASAPPLTTQLTDLTGVLASNTDTINSALGRLYDKTGVRL